MKNVTLLRTKQDYNEFTLALKVKIEKSKTGFVTVKLREGTSIKVTFQPIDSAIGCDSEFFRTEDHGMIWDPDGSSITSRWYDMIEFRG